jgi:LEA14-like dessication related protein
VSNELRKLIAAFGLFCVLGFLIAEASAKKDLSITLKEQKALGLTSSGLILSFHLNVANSSQSPYFLTSYSYRVLINQLEYLSLQTTLDRPLPIEARGSTLISLPVKITYELLLQAIPGIEEKASCDLSGELTFADTRDRQDRVPVAVSGSFPIFKDPQVELLPLQVKELTIGGSDLVFEGKFKNPNFFDLIVDRVTYKLLFAGKTVSEGTLGGNKNIDARGEKVFSLPLLLDFFEIGTEVFDALQKSSLPCQFSGEIEVDSVWGKLRIPFESRGNLSHDLSHHPDL